MPFIQLQFRRGTASQWTSANPILADGELAIETDTSNFKIGNGVASWNSLSYGGLVGPTGTFSNTITFDISFNGNIFIGKDLSLSGKLNVRNDVSFNSELRVGGNLNVRSGVASTSSATGALIVAGGIGVAGNVWSAGNLNIASDTSLNSRLIVGGNVLIRSNLLVGLDSSFNGNTSFAYLPVYNGSATPSANQLVTKTYVDNNGGTILLGADNTWTGNNNFNGSRFYVNADASFQNKLTVVDDVSLNARLFVGRDSSCNGNVTVGKNLFVAGDASFNNRFYVSKQIGVGVNPNAFYALDVLGNINLSGNLFLNNQLFSISNADISLNANLIVGLDASFNGNVFVSRTMNLRKTVVTGATSGSPTSVTVATPIIELTGSGASTAYFTLVGGSYAGQTLTIVSATNGGGGGLYVNPTGTNINFGGSNCTQMRFSSAFQTVYLIWNPTVSQWIVTSWQGVNFASVSMNFGTYTSGDITLGSAGKVNLNAGTGGLVVGSDSSFNGNLSIGGTDSSFNANLYIATGKRVGIGKVANTSYALDVGGNINLTGNLYTNGVLFSAFDNSKDISLNANLTVARDSSFNANLYVGNRLIVNSDVSLNQRLRVGGADSSFNGNLYLGGYLNSEGFIERFVNVASSSGTYTADFANGLIIYVNAFSGSTSPTLSITNLPTTLNQSYVFTVVYSGVATSTYFSALNINGVSVPVNGSVLLTAATSYYIHQFCIFFTDATNLANNFVVQNFNSSAPFALTSPTISGNLSVNGNINLVGGNIYQNGALFSGGGGSVGPSLSLGGNLYVGADISFGGNLFGVGDLSLNRRLFVGSDVSLGSKLYVVGDVSLNQRLLVGLDASINANVNVGGNINFRGSLYQNGVLFSVGPSLSLGGNLYVAGDISFGGNLFGVGDLSLNRRLFVGNDVSLGGNLVVRKTTASTSSATGALIVQGGAGIDGALYTNNIINTSGAITTTSSAATVSGTTGSIIANGGVGVGGNLWSGGRFTVGLDSSMNGNLNVGGNINIIITSASTSSATGALIVGGGVGVGGNVYTGGIVNVGSVTPSTSSGSGALIVSGGAGVGGNIYAGGIINVGSTTESVSKITGALIVGGGAGVGGNLVIGGNVNFLGNIYQNGTLFSGGGGSVGPNLSLTGNLSVGSTTESVSKTTGALIVSGGAGVGGNVQVGGNIVIAGTASATSFNATSDYRIKQNVLMLDASFNVDVLRPVSFINMKLGKPDIGFIAHEVGEYYPYLVDGEKDGEVMQSLNYTGIIGILTKEIQELKKRVSVLEKGEGAITLGTD